MRGVKGAWRGYVDLRGVRAENQRLEERVQYLETLLQERQHQAREAERLRELLGLREILPLETVAAEVVSRDGLPWYRTLTIDQGREHGVALEAPVHQPHRSGRPGDRAWARTRPRCSCSSTARAGSAC